MTDEHYHKIMFDRFVAYLALRYNNGEALYIAEWCDETLDRSGRLLSEVRDAARADPINNR
jgi:hypothetical protein